MRNSIDERFHLLKNIGGLPEPEVINQEWFYILKEVGKILNYSPDSIRTLISRGKFIAVKRGKEWLTHEKLLLKQNKGK